MNESSSLRGKRIALCVAGGIAAYKAVAVARLLVTAGAIVQPILTSAGARFVGKVTLSGITGRGVLDDMWDPRFSGEAHVSVADESDAIAIVPATADLLARLAEGRADDLTAALCLVAKSPIVIAPAMHPRMWSHPATSRNVDQLRHDGRVTFVGPVHGAVASGDVGVGRMIEPEDIVAALAQTLGAAGDFAGRHVVVSAGPTVEDLDPVRFLGNRSTGKMGFAVARAARARGARVTLVTGPVALPTPDGVQRIDVRGALEMQAELATALADGPADALIMAAAVADYRPLQRSDEKQKKSGDCITFELVKNPDLLAEIGAKRGESRRPVLVGFAVETGDLVSYARKKLRDKRVDLVVGNLAEHGFGGDDDRVVFVEAERDEAFEGEKRAIADRILDRVAALLSKP